MVLNLLIKPAWLFTELLVQDRISHEKYGVYAALFSLSFLFIHLADSGINVFVTKELAQHRGRLKELFANTFFFKLLALLVYPLFVVGVGYLLGYRGEHLWFLYLLALIQAILQGLLFLRANFQAFQMFRIDALASVTDKIILLALVFILFFTGITLPLYIYALLASAALTFAIYYFALLRIHGWIKPVIDVRVLKRVLTGSFPFALVGVLYAVNERIDMVMLERLGGAAGERNAGLYAAAYRWLDAFMMYLWTILPVFFAKFAAHREQPEEQQKIFNFAQLLTFVPLLFVCGFVLFYGDKLFWMFRHSTQGELATMTHTLKVLFLTAVVQGLFAVYGTYLNATGHEKKVSYMIVACIVLNVILNRIFIPSYGPVAAAWATLASTALIAVLYMWYVQGNTRLKIPVNLLIHLAVMTGGFMVLFYLLYLMSIPWYIASVIAGAALGGMVIITNAGNIRSVFKSS